MEKQNACECVSNGMSLLYLSYYREAELLKSKKDRNVVDSREQTDIQGWLI